MKQHHAELMTGCANRVGGRSEHLRRIAQSTQAGSVPASSYRLFRKSQVRIREASGPFLTSHGPGAVALGPSEQGTGNEADFSKVLRRPQMLQGADHDRVRADFIGGRGGGLSRIPVDGRRHHQFDGRDRQPTLVIPVGSVPTRAASYPTNTQAAQESRQSDSNATSMQSNPPSNFYGVAAVPSEHTPDPCLQPELMSSASIIT